MRNRERERQRHRQREKQAPCREPNEGLEPYSELDPGSPGSGPWLKAALNHWAALKSTFKREVIYLRERDRADK